MAYYKVRIEVWCDWDPVVLWGRRGRRRLEPGVDQVWRSPYHIEPL